MFYCESDTADGIALELVQDGLVFQRDLNIVSTNLKFLIDWYAKAQGRSVVFALVSFFISY